MSGNLSVEIADRLLAGLSEDDAFRALFQRDPRAALAQVGHAGAADPGQTEGPWDCLHGEGLPDKQQLRETRDALRAQMTSTACMGDVIFKIDA